VPFAGLADEKEGGCVMRQKISIGIDPGLSGAIAAISAGSLEVIEVMDTPVITSEGKRLYDIGGMANAIRHLSLLGDAVVILEQAQAMPGQGVSSTFSTGRGFGIWEGVLAALDVPYLTVRPSVWTKKVLVGVPGEGKARAIQFALRMFPGVELCPPGKWKAMDGRADALCLAYYGAGL
jgi:crossover junction endodeoxyribonuclease RuvC